MKKISALILLIFLLIIILVNTVHSQKEYKEIITSNSQNSEVAEMEIKELNSENYEIIKELAYTENINFFYKSTQTKVIQNNYQIQTNLNNINLLNKNYELNESCVSLGTKKSKCIKSKGIDQNNYVFKNVNSENAKFNDGIYYFWGDNLGQFLREINPIIQDINKIPTLNYYKQIAILIIIILTLLFVTFIFITYKYTNDEYKRVLLILNGYTKRELIYRYILKFWKINLSISIGLNVFSYLFFKSSIFEMRVILIIQFVILLIFSLNVLYILHLKTNKSINGVVKNKNNLNKFNNFLMTFKFIFLILFLLSIITLVTMVKKSYTEYHNLTQSYNIRKDYGTFGGTNKGNDTEEYIFSQQFHDTLEKISQTYLENVDYLYATPAYDENYKYLTVNPKYLEYNDIYDTNNQKIDEQTISSKNICYTLIPEKYKEQKNITSECENGKKIYIANNQKLPTYNDSKEFNKYGEITNSIITIEPNSYFNSFVDITSVYLPLKDSQPVNYKKLTEELKKAGIYDNVSAFRTINEKIKYTLLAQVLIIKILIIFAILLMVIFCLIINLVLENYFRLNYQKIILHKLQGESFFQRYKKLSKIFLLQMTFEILIVNIFTELKIYNSFIFFTSIIIIYSIILVFIAAKILRLENKNINQILKGAYD